jgi:hypothetical protein
MEELGRDRGGRARVAGWRVPCVALALLATGLSAALAMPVGLAAVQDPVPEVPPVAEATTLEALRAHPARWLGREVELVLQLRAENAPCDPLRTRFSPSSWRGFSAWSDAQLPWERAAWDDPARRLFVRRGGALAAYFDRVRPHDRLRVRAVVREVLLGEPWIEVLTATRLESAIGEGAILHATRARRFQEEGKHDLALEQLERALASPLPDHARAELLAWREAWTAPPPGRRGGHSRR